MDKKLLLDIFHVGAPSSQEDKMRDFLKSWLTDNKIEFEEDKVGNIYNISKIGYPLLAAHMDTVQDENDVKLAKFIKEKNGIISGLGIIGADDKNGIFIILELLKKIPDKFNFAFFVEEEIGLNGSNYFVSINGRELEQNILYGIVLDRRNAGNILCVNNDYGTFDFEEALEKVGKRFGYTPDTGTMSDADNLSDYISSTNLSVGYYNAHSKKEYTVVSEIENTIKYVEAIILEIETKFDKPTKTVYSYYGSKNKKRTSYHYDTYFTDKCAICGKEKDNTIYLVETNKSVCYDCYLKIKEEFDFASYPNSYPNSYYENSPAYYEKDEIDEYDEYDEFTDDEINKFVGDYL